MKTTLNKISPTKKNYDKMWMDYICGRITTAEWLDFCERYYNNYLKGIK